MPSLEELLELRVTVLEFLRAYYSTERTATHHAEMNRMKKAVGYDDRVWGFRLDTGEETFE